ncbi:hypothetical protein AMATHDRAFT_71098 [Amanita thiersii Skay4041]|uniref:AAA-ATPase-like domain-containing protein n=1 Tax=Amanita thiersii Skay4041 TaxID=703135 RepID=A0A2A9NDI4_9AGAR|nr:hypothetical protein AMATHDRAFT_71098 [Amanita thiersii Skay4041]
MTLRLNVLIIDDVGEPLCNVFPVNLVPDNHVEVLIDEARLRAQDQSLHSRLDPLSVTIWRLQPTLPAASHHDMAQKIKGLRLDRNVPPGVDSPAVQLVTVSKVSTHFSESGLPDDHVHVLLQLPALSESTTDLAFQKKRSLARLHDSETVYRVLSENEETSAGLPPAYGGFNNLTMIPNIIATDKTKYIELLDAKASYHYVFLRPQAWGKSTFLQTLEAYYDKRNEPYLNNIFGDLYIGKHPTPYRNTLLVLHFSFSMLSVDDFNEFKERFHSHLNVVLNGFLVDNGAFLAPIPEGIIDPANGSKSLQAVLDLVEKRGQKLFVGIDDHDEPITSILLDDPKRGLRLHADVESFFMTQFYTIINSAAGKAVSKLWITGVMPVFGTSFSELNAITLISHLTEFNGICGLTEAEVSTITKEYLSVFPLEAVETVELELNNRCGGYRFCGGNKDGVSTEIEVLYNPQLVFALLQGLEARTLPRELPRGMVIRAVPAVMKFMPGEAQRPLFINTFLSAMSGSLDADVSNVFGSNNDIEVRSVKGMITTILYYCGLVTWTLDGVHFKIPNAMVAKQVYESFRFATRRKQLGLKQVEQAFQEAYTGLLAEDTGLLVDILQRYNKYLPILEVGSLDRATLRSGIESFWDVLEEPSQSIPDVRLLVNLAATEENGRFDFVDMVIPGKLVVPCVTFRTLTLEELYAGEHVADGAPSDDSLGELRFKLEQESEEELLGRRVGYWNSDSHKWCHKRVADVKAEAFEQIQTLLKVMKEGPCTATCPGLDDVRVECKNEGCARLLGYVVVSLGGTGILGWLVDEMQTKWSFERVGER